MLLWLQTGRMESPVPLVPFEELNSQLHVGDFYLHLLHSSCHAIQPLLCVSKDGLAVSKPTSCCSDELVTLGHAF